MFECAFDARAKSITTDIYELESLLQRIKDSVKIIEQMLNKGQVEEVLKVEKDIVQLELAFEGLSYLDSISFDLIFKEYRQALLRDNERPLDNFNQEHRDLYMRMKFKALKDCCLPGVAVAAEEESKARY